MTKRLITLLLAAVLIFSLFPAHVLATEKDAGYQTGDPLEVEGTAAPTAKIPENTKWEQQGEAQQRPAEEPSCGKTPHAHGDGSSCDLQCTLEVHTHTTNCPADCSLHVHSQECCKTEHEHNSQCVPGCGQDGHIHITNGCGGEGTCTIPEHSHGDGSACQMECTLEEHAHTDSCYEMITYTTWKVVEDAVVRSSNSPNHQQYTIQFNGKTITLGLGEIKNDALHLFEPGIVGDYYSQGASWPFQRQIVLGALESQNNGNGAVTLAPAEFYNCISNVKFEITSCKNQYDDGNDNCFLADDPSVAFTPATSLEPDAAQILGVNMYQTHVMADPGNCFEADLKITFDLTLPGLEKETYTINSRAGYWGAPTIEINAPENADDLNSMLASYDAMVSWLQENDPEQYEAFQNGIEEGGPMAPLVYIKLPAVTYEKPIVCGIRIPNGNDVSNIELHGAVGTRRTVMPGLKITGFLSHVIDIDFVSDDSMDSGIHMDLHTTGNGLVNVETVSNCSFTGFDYGIRNEGSSFVRSVRYCTFTGCENGIYMNSSDTSTSGNINNGDNHHNTFRNCRYAVKIRNLPAQMTAYEYRMSDCIFENNFKDFHVTTSGNKHYYYFHRNFYDGTYSETASLATLNSTASFRAAAIETDASTTAVVVTNPCRVSSAPDSDLWVFGGQGQETRIFAEEAAAMPVAGNAFAAGEHKEITIISDNETEVATWIFGGESE